MRERRSHLIELAPIPVGPAAPPSDLAPGPLQPESRSQRQPAPAASRGASTASGRTASPDRSDHTRRSRTRPDPADRGGPGAAAIGRSRYLPPRRASPNPPLSRQVRLWVVWRSRVPRESRVGSDPWSPKSSVSSAIHRKPKVVSASCASRSASIGVVACSAPGSSPAPARPFSMTRPWLSFGAPRRSRCRRPASPTIGSLLSCQFDMRLRRNVELR